MSLKSFYNIPIPMRFMNCRRSTLLPHLAVMENSHALSPEILSLCRNTGT